VSASFLITLREGFEAALIVAIVLAFVQRSSRPEMVRQVWIGTLAGVGLACVVGWILHVTLDGLEGSARTNTFAVICFAAAALLTWMIFWMRTHARHIKKELEGKAGTAIAGGSAVGLAMVAFLAVAREGLETALFLVSTTTSDSGTDVLIGAVFGLVVACALGVLVYKGSSRINMRSFFQVTGVLIIIFAAGLVSKGIAFLQGQTSVVVYNVSGIHWLTAQSEVGKFLAGIFGWDPAPSVLQFIGYWAYLVPALVFFFWTPRQKVVIRTSTQTEPVTVGS
jgi:high-affinity iron transporter